MEMVASAVFAELVNRFMSFLIQNLESKKHTEEMLARVQHLLLRAHTIVDEAEVRHITNFGMLMQLKMLTQSMYRGHYVLDIFKYKGKASGSRQLSWFDRMKYCSSEGSMAGLQNVLEDLEAILGNMREFVVCLGGCERMFRGPYSTYLYIDNFMFGRHVERQQMINVLLQENPDDALVVLPVIGDWKVGKKTLVAHVCNHERVRDHFSLILRFHIGDEIKGKTLLDFSNANGIDHEKLLTNRSLIVVELISDVDEEDWVKFHSSATCMARGSKIIIISRCEKCSGFGTVQPIRLDRFSREEYWYLLKVLAFGAANPDDLPALALVGKEIAMALPMSLLAANVLGALLRGNLNVQFWLHILKTCKETVQDNLMTYGDYLKDIAKKGHSTNIAGFASLSCPLRCTVASPYERGATTQREPKMKFQDLTAGSTSLPMEFELAVWESRIPPYTCYIGICVQDRSQYKMRRKRRREIANSVL